MASSNAASASFYDELKDLKAYYYCHPIHHYPDASFSESTAVRDMHSLVSCPCCAKHDRIGDHFCNRNVSHAQHLTYRNKQNQWRREQLQKEANGCEDFEDEPSVIICENYSPSYTSRDDQIAKVDAEIIRMRASKYLTRQAIKEADKLLGEAIKLNKGDENDHAEKDSKYDSVERFYRSKSAFASSLNISALSSPVKVTTTTTTKTTTVVEKKKPSASLSRHVKTARPSRKFTCGGSAIFQPRQHDLFTDSDLLIRRKTLSTK